MAFSFKYKPIKLESGVVYRPLIPLTLHEKQSFDVFAMLDSGSDVTILPKEVADALGLELGEDNKVTGISRNPIKAKESNVTIKFGKGHELYTFKIRVLIPLETENIPIIIGREGFFNQFKITFDEQRKAIEFKKVQVLV